MMPRSVASQISARCRQPNMSRFTRTSTAGCRKPSATSAGTEQPVARRSRLDSELVRRGFARSREHAAQLINDGLVTVGGRPTAKPATQVAGGDPIVVAEAESGPTYVSRGAHKLVGALRVFESCGLVVAGRHCLDAGASTGGFTDVLLRAGAARVVAADVGYGQLAWPLRVDERVTVLERVNVRSLAPEQVGTPVDLVVGDLSFISLSLVLPSLLRCAVDGADYVLLVKPQFEVGREHVGSGGVVRDLGLRARAVRTVTERAAELGLGVAGLTASPLPGPSGNVEYFVWLRRGAPAPDEQTIERAVAEGPR